MTKRKAIGLFGLLGLLVAGLALLDGCATTGGCSIPTCATCEFRYSPFGFKGTATGTMDCMPRTYDSAKIVLNAGMVTEKTVAVSPVPTVGVPFSQPVSSVLSRPSTANITFCYAYAGSQVCQTRSMPVR